MSIQPDDEHPLEAIVFKPVYPPKYDLADLTYFGGYPTLSRKLTWPVGPKSGQPITFVGQVDLSKLPRIPENTLPSAGVLHFFTDKGDYGHPEVAVLFSDDASEPLAETSPPENLPILYDQKYNWNKHRGWATSAVHRPNAYPKWWMEPVVCLTHPDGMPGDDDSFGRTFPPPPPSQIPAPVTVRKGNSPIELWTPDRAFPYLWVFIEAWCRQLLSEQSFFWIMGPRDPDPKMIRECREWIRRAGSQERFARTTADVVSEFWRWVRSLEARRKAALPGQAIADYGQRIANGTATWLDRIRLRYLLSRPAMARRRGLQVIPQQANALAKSGRADPSFLENLRHIAGTDQLNAITQSTLTVVTNLVLARGPEAARAIPPAVIESNRKLHRPTVEQRHQMFGHRYPIQYAGPAAGTDHLLLQLSSSEGMNWMWGDLGEVLFWISDDDLANRRFDRILGSLEGS
jgi:hypothetical protein